jgi:hypothetical protein
VYLLPLVLIICAEGFVYLYRSYVGPTAHRLFKKKYFAACSAATLVFSVLATLSLSSVDIYRRVQPTEFQLGKSEIVAAVYSFNSSVKPGDSVFVDYPSYVALGLGEANYMQEYGREIEPNYWEVKEDGVQYIVRVQGDYLGDGDSVPVVLLQKVLKLAGQANTIHFIAAGRLNADDISTNRLL